MPAVAIVQAAQPIGLGQGLDLAGVLSCVLGQDAAARRHRHELLLEKLALPKSRRVYVQRRAAQYRSCGVKLKKMRRTKSAPVKWKKLGERALMVEAGVAMND